MVARIFTLIALAGVALGSPLSYWEQKLVGSWQIVMPSGERLVETFEPDRTHWVVSSKDGRTSLDRTDRWQIDEKHKLLVFERGTPNEIAIVINAIGENTLTLAQLMTYTRCDRPAKPSNQPMQPTASPRTASLSDD